MPDPLDLLSSVSLELSYVSLYLHALLLEGILLLGSLLGSSTIYDECKRGE
jgi:hypothetical protein